MRNFREMLEISRNRPQVGRARINFPKIDHYSRYPPKIPARSKLSKPFLRVSGCISSDKLNRGQKFFLKRIGKSTKRLGATIVKCRWDLTDKNSKLDSPKKFVKGYMKYYTCKKAFIGIKITVNIFGINISTPKFITG